MWCFYNCIGISQCNFLSKFVGSIRTFKKILSKHKYLKSFLLRNILRKLIFFKIPHKNVESKRAKLGKCAALGSKNLFYAPMEGQHTGSLVKVPIEISVQ